MNKELLDIITNYKKFRDYTNNIDIELFNKYSRQELIEFKNLLAEVNKFRFLDLKLNDIINKKKTEEYPQLLGVHHYPEINEIDFLNEKEKIELDKYLSQFKKDNYIQTKSNGFYNLTKKCGSENINKTIQFLIDKNIIKPIYEIKMCHDSIVLDEVELNKYLRFFELKNCKQLNDSEQNEYYDLLDKLEYLDTCLCSECDREIKLAEHKVINAKNSITNCNYKIIKDRDKSLDNV